MKKRYIIFLMVILLGFATSLTINSCMSTFNLEGTQDLDKNEIAVLKVPSTISINRVDEKSVNFSSDFWGNSYNVILPAGHHIFDLSYRSGNYYSVGMHKFEYSFEKGKKYKLTATRNNKEKIVEYDVKEN